MSSVRADTLETDEEMSEHSFEGDYVYEEIAGPDGEKEIKLIGWMGEEPQVVIPDTINNLPVTVIGRDPQYGFQKRELTSVTLGKHVRELEAYAFADNHISEIILPEESELVTIGDHALRDNELQTFSCPAPLQKIGDGAFANNDLRTLDINDSLASIGDIAFSNNHLKEVTIGQSVQSFGQGVFDYNGRYVIVRTENAVIPRLEKTPGAYGYVVDPVTVIVISKDSMTGDMLLSPQTIGEDMTSDNVFILGEAMTYEPIQIAGYSIPETITFTPDTNPYTLTLHYVSTTKRPVIELIGDPIVPPNTPEDDVERLLLDMVKATDLDGNDITAKVTVDKADLDPTVPGSYNVTYHVTDEYGNEGILSVDILVGTDWTLYPTGNGWVLGDFSYRGSTLLGFSNRGLEKLRSLSYEANERNVVLPAKSPYGERPSIKHIDSMAFNYPSERINEIDFSQMDALTIIGKKAFTKAEYTQITFGNLPNLKRIEDNALNGGSLDLTTLDLSGLTGLEYLGGFNEIPLKVVNFSGLHNLRELRGLHRAQIEHIDLSDLTSLEILTSRWGGPHIKNIEFGTISAVREIGDSVFRGTTCPIDLGHLINLESIGENAFTNTSGTITLPQARENRLPALRSIGNKAFYQSEGVKDFDLSELKNLVQIDEEAFYRSAIKHAEFVDMPLLTRIEASAFERCDDLKWVSFSNVPSLIHISEKAFFKCGLRELTFYDLPELQTIDTLSFSQNNIDTLSFQNLPNLTAINSQAFTYNLLETVTISNCPALQEVHAMAFVDNPGNSLYDNYVVIWVTPADLCHITSKGGHIVNPHRADNSNWNQSDFTYGTDNGLHSITGLSDSGVSKILNHIFPMVIPEKDPEGNKIERIASFAFVDGYIESLDMSPAVYLKEIGQYAFCDTQLQKVSFNGLKNLILIETYAFNNNAISEIDFTNVYRLEHIGDRAFTNMTRGSLAGRYVENLDLSDLESLKTLGSGAFENFCGGVTFGYHPDLVAISNFAFAIQRNVSIYPKASFELDLTGCPNLETIGKQAFRKQRIHSLNLENLSKLRRIEDEAFYYCTIRNFNFKGLSALETIGIYVFSTNYSNREGEHPLDLSDSVKLKILSRGSFDVAGVTSVAFPQSSDVVTISSEAFSGNRLTDVDLSPFENLTTIDSNAFANNRIKTLTLPMTGQLRTISWKAFYGANKGSLDIVYIPDSVRYIGNTAFQGMKNNNPNNVVILYTQSRNNPQNLPDSIGEAGGHIVDPNIVMIHYVDENGKELRAPQKVLNNKDDSITVEAADIGGYEPVIGEKTIIFNEEQWTYDVTFEYKPRVYDETGTLRILVEHENEGNIEEHVGNMLLTRLSIDVSSAVDELAKPQIKIFFNRDYIDASKIVVTPTPGLYTSKIGDDYVTITFEKLIGGDYFSIPIQWVYLPGVTPQHYAQDLITELRDAEDNVVAVSRDEDGHVAFPTIGAYYYEPMLKKGAPDETANPYAGGGRNFGPHKTTEIDGVSVKYVYEPHDVPFSFYIGQTMGNRKLERNMEKVTYIDTLPLYKAVENGEIVERRAVFVAENNPGWVYDETNQTVTFVSVIPNEPYVSSSRSPILYLQFPNAIYEQEVVNRVEAVLTPANRPDYEPEIHLDSDIQVTPIIPHDPPPPSGQFDLVKRSQRQRFYDLDGEKDGKFPWVINFFMASDPDDPDRYVKHLVLDDTNLDQRMYYYDVSLQRKIHTATITAYDANDIVVESGQTEDGYYKFERPLDIYRIEVDMGETVIKPEGYEIKINTRLRDPEQVHYNSNDSTQNYFRNCATMSGTLYSSSDEKIGTLPYLKRCDNTRIEPFNLHAHPKKTQTYPSSGQGAIFIGSQGTYTLRVIRTQNHSENIEPRFRFPLHDFKMVDLLPKGMMLTEQGISPSSEFMASPGAKYEIVYDYNQTGHTAIVFTADQLNPDVEIVAQIDTTTDILMEMGTHVNHVYMSFDEEAGVVEYGAPTEGFDLGDGRAYMHDEQSIALIKADYMQARKYIRYAEVEDGQWIPTSDWMYTGVETEGNGTFQYLLVIDNNTDLMKTGNEIYDVLPYPYDDVIQINNAGKRQKRGSQFSNTLMDVEIIGEFADDYRVQYTTDVINYPKVGDKEMEAGLFLKTLTWHDREAEFPVETTAFRIIPKENTEGRIGARSRLEVIVSMRAPEESQETRGKYAYNSFIRHDDSLVRYGSGGEILSERYLETNLVYNKIPYPLGSLKLIKQSSIRDIDNQPINLQGAEFTLYDELGKVVAMAVTDENGLAVFEQIPIENYTIKETKAPEGFRAPTFERTIRKQYFLNNTPTYEYDLGRVTNDPIFKGKIIIDKVGVDGQPLRGVIFELRSTSTSQTWTKTTDRDGRVEFDDLPQGRYTLTELKSVGHLTPKPIYIDGSQYIDINRPDTVIDLTGERAIVNDKAEVTVYKLGLIGSLDPGKTLAEFIKELDGLTLDEAWSYEVYEKNQPENRVSFTLSGILLKHYVLEDLKPDTLYVLKETTPPDDTVFKRNEIEYTFQVTAQGKLVDEHGKPFLNGDIYFPNEKKAMRGAVDITKLSRDDTPLSDAVFELFKLNEATQTFESTERLAVTDATGHASFSELTPGLYELREVKAPSGYAATSEPYRFVVEAAPTIYMGEPEYDVSDPDVVVHHFTYTAVNTPLELEIIKRHPLAVGIPESEADALLLDHPERRKVARGAFFDVYVPLAGVEFNMYEVISDDEQQETDHLLASKLVTDAEGRLPLETIPDFVLNEEATYRFVETKAPDDSWRLDPTPITIRIKDYTIREDFDGTITLDIDNFKNRGDILVSKYDRSTKERLSGVTFVLYKGRLEDILLDGQYNPDHMIDSKQSDENGFVNFTDLDLGYYVLVEEATLEGYLLPEKGTEIHLTGHANHAFISMYNLKEDDLFDLPIEKIWLGDRPNYAENEGIHVTLNRNGEPLDSVVLNEANHWKHTFTNLYKYDFHNNLYTYTVTEERPDGYQLNTAIESDALGIPIKITLNNYKLIELSVTKEWIDHHNADGLRPKSLSLQLMRDGTAYGAPVDIFPDDNGEWTYTFKDLLQTDAKGRPYVYTVEEKVNGYYLVDISNQNGHITITNQLCTDLTVEKMWQDYDDRYELRPTTIELQLQQNGKDFLDPVTVKADEDGNWTYVFTELPTYDADHRAYDYTVVETPLAGYEVSYEQTEKGIIVTNKLIETELPVEKTWQDYENRYQLRPATIELQLQQDGKNFLEPVTVKADEDGNWTYVFTELPKYDADNRAYDYTVVETPLAGYEVSYEQTESGINVTNKLSETELPVEKTWQDYGNRYQLRPATIELQLQQNGKDFLDPVTVKADEDGNWTYVFTELPKYDADHRAYDYTVVEAPLAGYEVSYEQTEKGIIVTNKLIETELPVEKTWQDYNDRYQLRPATIELQLQQNGKDFLDPVTVKADEDGNWTYVFTELPKYDADNRAYDYTVVETPLAGYEVSYEQTENGIRVTNKLIETELPVEKMWQDYDDRYQLRPATIELQLQQNGKDFLDPVTVKADEDGNWTYVFTELPTYDADHRAYDYTVVETPLAGYEVSYIKTSRGIEVRNTLLVTEISMRKEWDDSNNKYGIRPQTISLQLLQNGMPLGEPVEVREDRNGDWHYRFDNLPYVDGEGVPYHYSIEEMPVPGYIPVYEDEGQLIVNRLMDGDITVRKVWDDDDNQYRLRPNSIMLQLLQNGKSLGQPVTVSADKNGEWVYTFKGLPLSDSLGNPYLYTVEEVQTTEHYHVHYSADTLTITNKFVKPEKELSPPPTTGEASPLRSIASGLLMVILAYGCLICGVRSRKKEK